jgi:hypothetical protein
MKYLPVITAALLLGSPSIMAQEEPTTEQLLGAIAGGALGSTIGDGDGRKAATVIGAIIGYRMGERVLSSNDRRAFTRMGHDDFRRWCRHEVPYRYENDSRLRNQWISGCVNRLNRQQRELEREAYEDGYYGPSN